MHADTDAIRGYARFTGDLSADLQTAVTLLRRDIGPAVVTAFGPVGSRFAAALTDAAAALVSRVTNLSDELDASGAKSAAAAGDYDVVEQHARTQIAWAGT